MAPGASSHRHTRTTAAPCERGDRRRENHHRETQLQTLARENPVTLRAMPASCVLFGKQPISVEFTYVLCCKPDAETASFLCARAFSIESMLASYLGCNLSNPLTPTRNVKKKKNFFWDFQQSRFLLREPNQKVQDESLMETQHFWAPRIFFEMPPTLQPPVCFPPREVILELLASPSSPCAGRYC